MNSVTREAFGIGDQAKALKLLCTLRGVGPATASLLLSIHDPDEVPFFSDELFRWCLWEDKPGRGWDRSIKYNVKEYAELTAAIAELRRRLQTSSKSVGATDCEKVAYVLGKTDVDLAVPVVTATEEQTADASSQSGKELIPDSKVLERPRDNNKSIKRSHDDNGDPTTPAVKRRSTRRRQE